jgi:hypothetical protein
MNPVDHPHGGVSAGNSGDRLGNVVYLTRRYRVTINTLVRRRPSRGTPPRVRRRVSSLREGRVCCVVPRRRRSKGFHGSTSGQGVHRVALVFCCFVVMGLRRRTGDLLFHASIHGRGMNGRFPSAARTRHVYRAMYSNIRGRQIKGERDMQQNHSRESSSSTHSSLPGQQARQWLNRDCEVVWVG